MQHFREIGSLFFVWPGNMDQCSWRCKVHACHAVPISVSQLKIKWMHLLLSHTWYLRLSWCMTLSLYIGSFLVLSHTILCSLCIWGRSLIESRDSVNVHHDWQPVYQTCFALLWSDCGEELRRIIRWMYHANTERSSLVTVVDPEIFSGVESCVLHLTVPGPHSECPLNIPWYPRTWRDEHTTKTDSSSQGHNEQYPSVELRYRTGFQHH